MLRVYVPTTPYPYMTFQELADKYGSLRDIADHDETLWLHRILPNLIGASIVNKCVSCFTSLCDYMHGDDNLMYDSLVITPLVYAVDATLTRVDIREMSVEDLYKSISGTRGTTLLAAYYGVQLFDVFVSKCLRILVDTNVIHDTHVIGTGYECEHDKVIFHTIAYQWSWARMYKYQMQALAHLLSALNNIKSELLSGEDANV